MQNSVIGGSTRKNKKATCKLYGFVPKRQYPIPKKTAWAKENTSPALWMNVNSSCDGRRLGPHCNRPTPANAMNMLAMPIQPSRFFLKEASRIGTTTTANALKKALLSNRKKIEEWNNSNKWLGLLVEFNNELSMNIIARDSTCTSAFTWFNLSSCAKCTV